MMLYNVHTFIPSIVCGDVHFAEPYIIESNGWLCNTCIIDRKETEKFLNLHATNVL
jgi:hypothetical protein